MSQQATKDTPAAAFAAQIEAFFAAQGPLAAAKAGYEVRPDQAVLAREVGQALLGQTKLLAEAGTGTGKTLAYLVPALLSRLKVVVSTATKQLQDQILSVDLPAIEAALGRRFDVVVMKGRQNYLCEARTEQTVHALRDDAAHAPLLQALASWRRRTETGERGEFAALGDDNVLWQNLTASREQCMGRSCSFYERCWVVQMRRRAQQADMVIVNHHLFFADAALQAGEAGSEAKAPAAALLPPFEAVIFDEADELDDVASLHFGHGISEAALLGLLNQVVAPHQQEAQRPALAPLVTRTQAHVRALFATLPPAGRALLNVASPNDHAARRLAHLGIDEALAHLAAELESCSDEPSRQLGAQLDGAAHTLSTVLGVAPRAGLLRERGQPSPEPPASERVHDGRTPPDHATPVVARTSSDAFVRFGEVMGERRQISARPIDVTRSMAQATAAVPCVFLSATMQLNGSFAHVQRRLGLDACTTLAQPSAFDFARQAALYVPDDLPEPSADRHHASSAARTVELCAASGGGALVLCTSTRAVHAMAEALQRHFAGPLLVQGSAPKAHLLHAFGRRTDAVLLASLGFWRGVDIPGPALRLVIMDRIPFAVPTDPLVEARTAALVAAGKDAFFHFQLPQAALLLRQGFGRLIRGRQDRGVVAILDRRLTSRRYGPELLRALPSCPRLHTWEQVEQRLRTNQATE